MLLRQLTPKQSLMNVVEYGFVDDLLIGNFMKVRLVNTRLYPRFTPQVAKIGGNAKVYTRSDYRHFLWRYFRRNPRGTLAWLSQVEIFYVFIPAMRGVAERFGLKSQLKRAHGWLMWGERSSPGHP